MSSDAPDPQRPPNSYEWRDLRNSIEKLNATMQALPDKMAEIYVRKDVLEPQMATMNKQIEQHSKFFNWVVTAVGAAILTGLVTVLVVLVQAKH